MSDGIILYYIKYEKTLASSSQQQQNTSRKEVINLKLPIDMARFDFINILINKYSQQRKMQIQDSDDEDFNCIEWEDQNNDTSNGSLQIELGPNVQKKTSLNKQRRAIRFEEDDYSEAFERYKICLADMVKRFVSIVTVCSEIRLIECLKSTIPTLFTTDWRLMNPCVDLIRNIYQQFSAAFTRLKDGDYSEEEVGDGTNPDLLIATTIPRLGGSSMQLNQLFTALVHSLHYRVRLVASFDPSESFLPMDHDDLRRKRWETSGNEANYKKAKDKKKVNSIFWTEVYLPIDTASECVECCDLTGETTSSSVTSIQRDIWGWVHVDALNNTVNTPSYVESSLRKGKAVHFVLAAEPNGEITDVTSQYSTIHTHNSNTWKTIKLLADSYLCELIRKENLKVPASLSNTSYNSSDSKTKRRRIGEVDSTSSNSSSSSSSSEAPLPSLPTRFIDFKDHPVYLLERFLLANKALHPLNKKSVGIFRGETVYLQSHRELLKSKVQWRREMRTVRDSEEPYKVAQRRFLNETESSSSSSSSNSHSNTEIKEISLYGIWQTIVLEICPVVDDVLPSNEHGNIEIWDGLQKYVPKGAAYIRNNRAKSVATNLGISFVPALIGFDRSGSHTVPKLDGVIVLQRHEQLMLDAMFYVDAVKDELQYMKSEKKIVEKWFRLVVSVLNRQALRATYGH